MGANTLFTGQRERKRDGETEREREGETERERQRLKEGETERERKREAELSRIVTFISKGMTVALAPFSYLVFYICSRDNKFTK